MEKEREVNDTKQSAEEGAWVCVSACAIAPGA
jgi:hypothetical protein